jgi:hypothetical protein
MQMPTSERSYRWIAVKILLGPPLFVAVLAVAFVTFGPGTGSFAPFLVQVAAGLGAIIFITYRFAPTFARFCHRSVFVGCIFAMLVCAGGALAFGLAGAAVHSDHSFPADVLRPFSLSVFYGFPIAGLTGFFFSGAAQRLTVPPR